MAAAIAARAQRARGADPAAPPVWRLLAHGSASPKPGLTGMARLARLGLAGGTGPRARRPPGSTTDGSDARRRAARE